MGMRPTVITENPLGGKSGDRSISVPLLLPTTLQNRQGNAPLTNECTEDYRIKGLWPHPPGMRGDGSRSL